MNAPRLTIKAVLAAVFFLSSAAAASAQVLVRATAPDAANPNWVIEIAFATTTPPDRIKDVFLLDVASRKIIDLRNLNPVSAGAFVYTANPAVPLTPTLNPQTNNPTLNNYQFQGKVVDAQGEMELITAPILITNFEVAVNKVQKARAKESDDSDVYVSGELNGAHKQKTSFTTEIKLQKYMTAGASWMHTPFFKLNASTDPDADPDKMEAGWNFRYVTGRFLGTPGAYFDQDVKFESERDFDNTNLIYDARLTLLPAARPKGLSNKKLFINPYIGTELGKNVRSPLKAAEGDGIARLLAGIDLRAAFFLTDGDTPDINWTASYVRRWPLTDELGFEADEDGNLQLRTFGTNPRDSVSTKFSYRLSKFLDAFAGYEWGRVPPSYKLVDHRFRLGFAYKFKFAVK